MGVEITDDVMTTGFHRAYRQDNGLWAVEWMSGRELDRNAAITALLLAEAVEAGKTGPSEAALAAELGLTVNQAARMMRGQPVDTDQATAAAAGASRAMLANELRLAASALEAGEMDPKRLYLALDKIARAVATLPPTAE